MKLILLILAFLSGLFTCYAIQQTEPEFKIIDQKLVSKAKYTTYPQNFILDVFSKNKYLKVKIKGDFSDDFNLNYLKVNMVDSNYHRFLYKRFFHFSFSSAKCRTKKKERNKYNHNAYLLKKKKNYFLLSIPLRRELYSLRRSDAIGYKINKGTYFLYLEYSDDNGYFKTNTIEVTFK